MRHSIIAACAVALVLAAAPASAKDELAGVKSVAIISAIGDCLYLPNVRQQSMGILGAAVPPVCMKGEGFDEAVTQQITQALSARFTVKTVKYDRAPFAEFPFESKLFEFTETDIDKPLKALANPGVDAYVVVQKMRMSNVFADSDAAVYGIGIAYVHELISGHWSRMFAYYRIKVIDAHTFKTLLSEPARLPKTGWLPNWPTRDLDESLWQSGTTFSRLTDAQMAEAHPLMTGLLHDSVANTLKIMGLVQ